MPYTFDIDLNTNSLDLGNNKRLGQLPKDYQIYLDQSTILYGAGGTGKSTVVAEILYLLKDHVPNITAFVPSNEANEAFTGIIPASMIHRELEREKLEDIFEKQEEKMKLYNEVNRLENLRSIFNKVKNIETMRNDYNKTMSSISQLDASIKQYITRTKNSDIPSSVKSDVVKAAQKTYDDNVVGLYKKCISKHQASLMVILDDKADQTIVKFINLNPRLIILFDDCIEQINAISGKIKKNGITRNSVMDTIFFRGRHALITLIVTTQSDVKVLPPLRKNAYLSVFTDEESSGSYIDNKANNLSKTKRAFAHTASEVVFASHNKKKHTKFCHYRLNDENSEFSYTIANRHNGDFRMCSDVLWTYCEKLEVQSREKTREFLRSGNFN